MWKQPRVHELDAPREIKDQINDAIYWNSSGSLSGAPLEVVLQYVVALIVLEIFIIGVTISLLNLLGLGGVLILIILLIVLILTVSAYVFYVWGWKSYKEAWYTFDEKEELFTVVLKSSEGWETFEIPFEEIEQIEYVDGSNGKAIIKSGKFNFETNRALEKRKSSVTDLWPELARIDTEMKNWPITLGCQVCDRTFGHHIGTAQCPFDKVALLEKNVKGRIDPQEQHKDDLDRI